MLLSQSDTIIINYKVPTIDYDSPADAARHKATAPICAECRDKLKNFQGNRYRLFMKYVYDSAMKNPALSAANRLFLEKLKEHMMDGKKHRIEELIRPVRKVTDRYGATSIRIFEDGWKKPAGADSVDYYVYYSNSKENSKERVLKPKGFKAACITYKSYILKYVKKRDKQKPEFCTPYHIELEYVSDRKTNSLLRKQMDCNNACNWYCDNETAQVTFAKLKGVPNLYFTCDTNEWGVWFPAQGLFMNVGNRYAYQIWKFTLEMVECSCI